MLAVVIVDLPPGRWLIRFYADGFYISSFQQFLLLLLPTVFRKIPVIWYFPPPEVVRQRDIPAILLGEEDGLAWAGLNANYSQITSPPYFVEGEPSWR